MLAGGSVVSQCLHWPSVMKLYSAYSVSDIRYFNMIGDIDDIFDKNDMDN
jgi:hypothetical protein